MRSIASALLDRRRHRARQFRLPALHLDDDARVRVPREHVIEPRDADALASKRMLAIDLELKPGIDARELRGRQRADRSGAIGRPVECLVVNDDWDAVGGELHVDLEAVGAERHAVVDRRHGVFGREFGAAAMGEDERTIGLKDGGQSRGHAQC